MKEAMKKVRNPHDLYFKETMSKLPNAKSFLESYLPKAIAEQLDIESLKIEKGSFISKDLEEYYSDMIYHVSLKKGGTGYVYVLMEHKSYQDSWVAMQLLEYMLQCWKKTREEYVEKRKKEREEQSEQEEDEEEIEQEEKEKEVFHLPIVIPIVLYHGRTEWRWGNNMKHLFDCDAEMQKFIPDFSYILYDLTKTQDKDIWGIVTLQLMLKLFKHIRTPEFQEKLIRILESVKKGLPSGLEKDILISMIVYIMSATKMEKNTLSEIISKNFDKGDQLMISTADRIRQEGRIEGRIEGEKKGRIEGEKKGEIKGKIEAHLEFRFGARGLHRMKQIQQISDLEKLKEILQDIRTASDIESFEKRLDECLE